MAKLGTCAKRCKGKRKTAFRACVKRCMRSGRTTRRRGRRRR